MKPLHQEIHELYETIVNKQNLLVRIVNKSDNLLPYKEFISQKCPHQKKVLLVTIQL